LCGGIAAGDLGAIHLVGAIRCYRQAPELCGSSRKDNRSAREIEGGLAPPAIALTVIETCRVLDRSAFAFITTALERHFARQTAPSLMLGL
jgi:hypothetical protein